MEYTFAVPCLFGLEALVARELSELGIDAECENGRVRFNGTFSDCASANICLRTGERVYLELASFQAQNFDDVFDNVRNIEFPDILPKDACFPVNGSSISSKLSSIPALQRTVKKAAVESMQRRYGLNTLPENGARYSIEFFIKKDVMTVYIDTTGTALYKRGYRKDSVIAPIRETLAAAIVMLSGYDGQRPFCDPFCGSGTLPIEAAMIASNIAPGVGRSFAFEHFAQAKEAEAWKIRRLASNQKRAVSAPIFASDIDALALKSAESNSQRAGVSSFIKFSNADFADFVYPSNGVICANPPYGERLLDIDAARQIYKKMGAVFAPITGAGKFIISPDDEFERYFGSKANKKRKLYNGMMKCFLNMYFRKRSSVEAG